MLSRFHRIPERYRRTDLLSISRVSMLTRDKNSELEHVFVSFYFSMYLLLLLNL